MLNFTKQLLSPYLPKPALERILRWFARNPVTLVITKDRSSKSGDYRAPRRSQPARIGINRSLNQYEFLITLVHEMAHHSAWLAEQNKKKFFLPIKRSNYKPHGKAWKNCFRRMMQPYLTRRIFPADILLFLKTYLENPRAATSADLELRLILKKYDEPDGSEFVADLPYDAVFRLPGGRKFRKKEKLRKRFRCIRMDTNQVYLFSPAAEVFRA